MWLRLSNYVNQLRKKNDAIIRGHKDWTVVQLENVHLAKSRFGPFHSYSLCVYRVRLAKLCSMMNTDKRVLLSINVFLVDV